MTGLMKNVNKRSEQSKEYLKGSKGQRRKILKSGKCIQYKQLLTRKKNEFDRRRIEKLKQSLNDPKIFWRTIRSVNRKATIYNDITGEQWYEHFFNVFNTTVLAGTVSQLDEMTNAKLDEDIPEALFNEAISTQEVIASIGKLKSGKSSGPDKIIGEMLKHANDVVIDFLVTLFDKLFDHGTFPQEWSKSIIVPIHKKGDVNQPDNYRGITLTNVISKVYTHILIKTFRVG